VNFCAVFETEHNLHVVMHCQWILFDAYNINMSKYR